MSIIRTGEFSDALTSLLRGDNVFLTGNAGTGKSTLVRTFLAETDRNAVVVAPTGIAALNVQGYTIHRLFSFRPDTTLETVRSGRYRPKRFASTLRKLETLVIDEASMVRADMFDMIDVALRRFGPNHSQPFGGIQIVLVGDLYQLAPIVRGTERSVFEQEYETPFFFSANAWRDEDFSVHQLSRVFRQEGSDRLIEVLNEVRDGSIGPDGLALLNERVERGFVPPSDEMWLTLAATNRIADARNESALAKIPSRQQTYTAKIYGDLDGFDKPAPDTLTIKVGAQVMMLNNDHEERWVNGTIGTIEAIRPGSIFGSDEIIVRSREGDVFSVERASWEVQRPTIVADSSSRSGSRIEHETLGSYSQYPMKLAWAVTIHKSQGQTLDRLVVDLEGGAFATGQLYVALSRCTSLEGMVLLHPVRPRDVMADRRAREFLERSAAPEPVGTVFLDAIVTSGPDGEPHLLELAGVGSDGTELTTLVNPQTDSFSDCQLHGIDPADLAFAPNAAQAWTAFARVFGGHQVAGGGIASLLDVIGADVRRHGGKAAVPLRGAASAILEYGTALHRARAARDAGVVEGAGTDLRPIVRPEDTSSMLILPRDIPWSEGLSGSDREAAAAHIRRCALRAGMTKKVMEGVRAAEKRIGVPSFGDDPIAGVAKAHITGPAVIRGRLFTVEDLEAVAKLAKMRVIREPDRATGPILFVHNPDLPLPSSVRDNPVIDPMTFMLNADIS